MNIKKWIYAKYFKIKKHNLLEKI